MKTDYSDMIGKTVKITTDETYIGVVAGADYHIGISVVDPSNATSVLFCLNGLAYYKAKKKICAVTKTQYRRTFHRVINLIRDGEISPDKLLGRSTFTLYPECPFSM